MARRSRPLQGADIFFVQANRGRNQSCHTLTIQRTREFGNASLLLCPSCCPRLWHHVQSPERLARSVMCCRAATRATSLTFEMLPVAI